MQGPHVQYKNETRKRSPLSIALLSNEHITVEPPLSGRPSIKWSVIKVSNNNNFEDAERLRPTTSRRLSYTEYCSLVNQRHFGGKT